MNFSFGLDSGSCRGEKRSGVMVLVWAGMDREGKAWPRSRWVVD